MRKMRSVHIDGEQYRYYIGKRYVKFIMPNNKVVLKTKLEVAGVTAEEMVIYQNERIRDGYEVYIPDGVKIPSLNPQRIKDYLTEIMLPAFSSEKDVGNDSVVLG